MEMTESGETYPHCACVPPYRRTWGGGGPDATPPKKKMRSNRATVERQTTGVSEETHHRGAWQGDQQAPNWAPGPLQVPSPIGPLRGRLGNDTTLHNVHRSRVRGKRVPRRRRRVRAAAARKACERGSNS